MRARIIANPVAGADAAAAHVTAINERLAPRFGPLDIVLTTGPGDAMRAARDAALRGYEHVFVAGGDGTLNETLNGLAAIDGALGRIGLGILPLGTGNDFATALGIPADAAAALESVAGADLRPVDVGRVTAAGQSRLFLNVSAGGFIAEVSDAVDPALKSVAGRLAYLVGGARVLLSAEPFTCRANGQSVRCLMFAVCNAPMIGGGRLIAPDAVPDDGALDACLVHAMDLLDFVALLRRVADGTHVTDERVTYFSTRALVLEFDRPLKVNADGEVFQAARCEYDLLPGAVRVLAPPR